MGRLGRGIETGEFYGKLKYTYVYACEEDYRPRYEMKCRQLENDRYKHRKWAES